MTDLENYLMNKQAEVSGTKLMPTGAQPPRSPNDSPHKTIPKVGEAMETNDVVEGEQIKKLPQQEIHVDTTGQEAPIEGGKKEAQYYALPSYSRYPLDSYGHVKQASEYFSEYKYSMSPEMRREYCSNLVKRASMLGIEISREASKYGGEGYASDAQIEAALLMRNGVIKEASYALGLKHLAEHRKLMNPEDFSVALGEFDKVAGLDHLYGTDIPDPYWSTFGEKLAEDDEDSAILVGNDYISKDDLKNFAGSKAYQLEDAFGDDFVKEFRKDPVGVTKSLPNDQKKVVIRIATSALTDPTVS